METFLWVFGALIVSCIVCALFSNLWEDITSFLFGYPQFNTDLSVAIYQGCQKCTLDPAVNAAIASGLPLTPALQEKLVAYYREGVMKGVIIYYDKF